MKYTVTVTKDRESEGTIYRDDTIFKQSFEELDLAALAIFLNQPNKTSGFDWKMSVPEQQILTPNMVVEEIEEFKNLVQYTQDEPSSQGMP